jgi:hypothetical protein
MKMFPLTSVGCVPLIVPLLVNVPTRNSSVPSFGGQKSQIQALKLVIYAYTASWVAGIALIIPILGGLVALAGGIYSLYTMYLGLPKLMKCPPDKTVGYFVVTIVVAIVVYAIIGIIVGAIIGMLLVGAAATGAAAIGVH